MLAAVAGRCSCGGNAQCSKRLWQVLAAIGQHVRLQALAASPDIYDKLVQSLAPGIWQLDDIKKGLLCQLFGGTSKVCCAAPPPPPPPPGGCLMHQPRGLPCSCCLTGSDESAAKWHRQLQSPSSATAAA